MDKRKQTFNKKNSRRNKAQEYVPFDGTAFLEQLKKEKQEGTYQTIKSPDDPMK